MKTFQRLCAAVALTLTLTLPVFAGEMSTGPGITSPPPSAPASATAQGEMDTGAGYAATADDSIAEVALSFLQSVLSLF